MMQDKIIIKAPAKINLFLHVLNKREDGYHNINQESLLLIYLMKFVLRKIIQ